MPVSSSGCAKTPRMSVLRNSAPCFGLLETGWALARCCVESGFKSSAIEMALNRWENLAGLWTWHRDHAPTCGVRRLASVPPGRIPRRRATKGALRIMRQVEQRVRRYGNAILTDTDPAARSGFRRALL